MYFVDIASSYSKVYFCPSIPSHPLIFIQYLNLSNPTSKKPQEFHWWYIIKILQLRKCCMQQQSNNTNSNEGEKSNLKYSAALSNLWFHIYIL